MHLILFILLFISFFFFHYYKGGNRKAEVVSMGIILFLFAALRDKSVGIDVHTYVDYYENCNDLSIIEIVKNTNESIFYYRDKLFYVFLKILTFISSNPQIMLIFISAWISLSFSFFVYKQKTNTFLLFTMFIAFRMFAFTMTGLRETMALGFVFFAICALQKRKIILSILLTLFGSLFHLSAAFFFLAIILSFFKNYKILASLAIIFLLTNFLSGNRVIYFISQHILFGRYSSYGAKALEKAFDFSFTSVIYLFFGLFVLYCSDEMVKNDKGKAIDINILIMGLSVALIGQSVDNIFRISYYFIPTLYSTVGESLSYKFNKKVEMLITVVICLLLIGQYLILGPGAGINDYKFFWE